MREKEEEVVAAVLAGERGEGRVAAHRRHRHACVQTPRTHVSSVQGGRSGWHCFTCIASRLTRSQQNSVALSLHQRSRPLGLLGGVTVFEMGFSLPWHEPVLPIAVRTVYQRNAVIFQYTRLEADRPLTQKHFDYILPFLQPADVHHAIPLTAQEVVRMHDTLRRGDTRAR